MKPKKPPLDDPPYVRPGDGSPYWTDAPEGYTPGMHLWYAPEGSAPIEHVVVGSHQAMFGLVPIAPAVAPEGVDETAGPAHRHRSVRRQDLYPTHAAARVSRLLVTVRGTQAALSAARKAHAVAVGALEAARVDAAMSRGPGETP